MDSATDKKTFLLEEPGAQESCRSRQVHNPWAVLCILFVILAAVFSAAFAGGYFLGKDKGTSTADSLESSDSYTHRAYSVHYDGKSHVIPAFRGVFPVEDFIQPRAALVNGQLVNMPGNPLLTPKGTSQIFIYQFEDEVSFIVTATGPNYGEEVSNASMTGDGQYTLRTSGLQGELVQLTDGYHQLYDRVSIPDSLSLKLQWGNVGSHGYIFVLSDPTSLDATLDFTGLTGSQQPLNIRGCHQYDTEIADLPTPNAPLKMTPYTGQFSLHNKPEVESETPISGSSDSSNLKLVQLNSNSRRRRSMTTRLSRGMAFILSHPDTKEVLHRIELTHEVRHGGKKGSICWNIQNNVKLVEASFCPLFHQSLYDGTSNKPKDDGSHSMVINTHYRMKNDKSDEKATWDHASFLAHDFNPDSVLQKLHSRDKRGFFSKVWSHRSQLFSAGKRLYNNFNQIKDAVEDSVHVVKGVINDFQDGSRRKLLWNCGWGKSLLEGGKCLAGGVDCGTDLAGEEPSFGLDTGLTIAGCGLAINDCAEFGGDCF